MKNILLLLLFVILLSCNKKSNVFQNTFNSSRLPLQEYSINIQRDTSLITKAGIIIKIDANSIASSVNPVTIQVKEALTISDMVRGGLFTKSNDTLLSSDGMFYINTKENSTIEKPLHVDVPRNAPDDVTMKLYTGKASGNSIDWVKPEEINKIKKDSVIANGENIFKTNCVSCHHINEILVGPALAGIEKLRPRKWLYDYTRNNSQLIDNGDRLACCLSRLYNENEMPEFTNLTDADLNALYTYIANETKKGPLGSNYNPPHTLCDSCLYYEKLAANIKAKQEKLLAENETKVMIENIPPAGNNNSVNPNPINVPPTNSVTPEESNAEYYKLNIKMYGWYNLDICFKEQNNLTPSNLIVRLKMPVEVSTSVMLVIPSVKLFTEGGKLADSGYGFDDKNGNIPLPQNTHAYVIAFAEGKEKIYFAMKEFMTSTSQTIFLGATEKSKYEVEQIIQSFGITGIEMNVSKAKNADKIEMNENQLRKLESKIQICTCYGKDTSRGPRSRLENIPGPPLNQK